MERVSIERPVVGWNAVPGTADELVWWDGTAFTHDAVRTDGVWSVSGTTGTPDSPLPIDPMFSGPESEADADL